jgi:hypothetical protein
MAVVGVVLGRPEQRLLRMLGQVVVEVVQALLVQLHLVTVVEQTVVALLFKVRLKVTV